MMSDASLKQAEIMLILKFRSVANGYKHWRDTPYTEKHNLSDDEMTVIMNYYDINRFTIWNE